MTEKQVPWWTLHEVADELGATLRHISCVDSNGRRYKRVVIEYEEKEVTTSSSIANGGQESERAVMVLESIGLEFLLNLTIDFNHKQFEQEFGDGAEYPSGCYWT